jgi:GT2 family glycosyltransferase
LACGRRRPNEIVVVDQTDPDDRNPIAFEELKEYERQGLCRIIEHPVKSLTVARNIGVLNSESDILIFLDDDAFIPPSFVANYIEIFADETVDAVTGMIVISESDQGTLDRNVVHPSIHDGKTMVRGGNFGLRRKALLQLGGFDEKFLGAANYEDADLAYRIHQAGLKVVWAPKPWLFHLAYGGGGGRIANPRANVQFAYNVCYFHMRHNIFSLRVAAQLIRWRVFNKDALLRPWSLPKRLWDLYRGYRMAASAVVSGPKLPLRPTT